MIAKVHGLAGPDEFPVSKDGSLPPLQAEATTSDSSSSGSENGKTAEGPPRTPWGIAAFILGILVTAFSWIFKVWDGSDFPETLAHPAYSLLLGLVLLLGGLWAFRAGNRRSRLDFAIVEVMFVAAAVMFGASVFVYRKANPSEKAFTVVLFTFVSHTTPKDVGDSFRQNLQRELESKYGNDILVLPRDREIKGETPAERARGAREWGSRGSGCHLAVWAELFTAKDGENYDLNLHWVKVYPFGVQVKKLEDSDEAHTSYLVKPTGSKGAVGPETINLVANEIFTLMGAAYFDRADYDSTIRILSVLGTARSEYFTGRAAYEKALLSTLARQYFQKAEQHYLRAIEMDPDGEILGGTGPENLGRTYGTRLLTEFSDDPVNDLTNAIWAFSRAAEIYKKREDLPRYAYVLLWKANMVFERSKLEKDPLAKKKGLDDAESELKEAITNLDPESDDNSFAQNLLGAIYQQKRDYEKSVIAHETALRFIPKASQAYRSETLTYLGQAQTLYAWRIHDRALHEKGLGSFSDAVEICQLTAIPYDCYLAHYGAGTALYNWADKWLTVGTSDWFPEIEKAITEFDLAATFLSKSEQTQLYAEAKRRAALAKTRRSLSEEDIGRQRFLKPALSDLTDAIDALLIAGMDATQLYRERAKCYDRLRVSSGDDAARKEYATLANRDSDEADRLARRQATIVP